MNQVDTNLTDVPLWYRVKSSDLCVFRQVYVSREYDIGLRDPKVIIDAGANVGYASHFFLTEYHDCHVLAIEPDESNFNMMRKNLSPFASRVDIVKGALWPRAKRMKVVRGGYRGNLQWSYQVRESEPLESLDCYGFTMHMLANNFDSVDLLKIDIEGSEVALFAGETSWLSKVKNIAIELHDDSQFGNATDAFMEAIDGYGFKLETRGQLTIARKY